MSLLQGNSHLWVPLAQMSTIIVTQWSTFARTTLSSHQNDQLGVTRSGPFEAALLIAPQTFDFSDIQPFQHIA